MLKLILFLIVVLPHSLLGVVRISNMNDFAFNSWPGYGDLQATDGICIYDTQQNSRYRVRISGSGAGSIYTISNGLETIPFTVQFAGSNGSFRNMPSGRRRRFNAAVRDSSTCNGTTNAQLRVSFVESDLRAAGVGTYTGIITLILQP